ncbi:hypothetical protein ABZ726_24130, partial [Streptomyces hundungensis]|uniref:hypothetical protein n=1 Tax=Streptomyces hundungensis TaxID=1077946 RepID=UPI0033F33BB3
MSAMTAGRALRTRAAYSNSVLEPGAEAPGSYALFVLHARSGYEELEVSMLSGRPAPANRMAFIRASPPSHL